MTEPEEVTRAYDIGANIGVLVGSLGTAAAAAVGGAPAAVVFLAAAGSIVGRAIVFIWTRKVAE